MPQDMVSADDVVVDNVNLSIAQLRDTKRAVHVIVCCRIVIVVRNRIEGINTVPAIDPVGVNSTVDVTHHAGRLSIDEQTAHPFVVDIARTENFRRGSEVHTVIGAAVPVDDATSAIV